MCKIKTAPGQTRAVINGSFNNNNFLEELYIIKLTKPKQKYAIKCFL